MEENKNHEKKEFQDIYLEKEDYAGDVSQEIDLKNEKEIELNIEEETDLKTKEDIHLEDEEYKYDVKETIEKNTKEIKDSKENQEIYTEETNSFSSTAELQIPKEAVVLKYTLDKKEVFETMQSIYKIQFGKRRIIQSVLLIALIVIFTVLFFLGQQKFIYMTVLSALLLLLVWVLPFFYNKSASNKNIENISKIRAAIEKDKVTFYQDEEKSELYYGEKNKKTKLNCLEVFEYPYLYILMYDKKNLFCIPKRAIYEEGYINEDIREIFKINMASSFYDKT